MFILAVWWVVETVKESNSFHMIQKVSQNVIIITIIIMVVQLLAFLSRFLAVSLMMVSTVIKCYDTSACAWSCRSFGPIYWSESTTKGDRLYVWGE